MVGTVLSEYAGVEPYVSRSFGTWTRSGRRMLAVTVLMGSVVLVGFASCGEAETEATPPPAATAAPTIAPPLVTAPARSPSPAPIPTETPEPTPTAQPAPRPVPAPTPTPDSMSEASPDPTPAPAVDAIGAPAEASAIGVVQPQVGLNVRDAPSVDEGTVQYVALRGEELELTGETSESDGIVWYELADGNWAQGQYLEITEEAPVATPVATPEATPEAPVQTIGVVVPEIGLNVRDAPSVADGAVQYVALKGEELVLTGQTVEADDALWYEIEDGNWVQGQYLEFQNPA